MIRIFCFITTLFFLSLSLIGMELSEEEVDNVDEEFVSLITTTGPRRNSPMKGEKDLQKKEALQMPKDPRTDLSFEEKVDKVDEEFVSLITTTGPRRNSPTEGEKYLQIEALQMPKGPRTDLSWNSKYKKKKRYSLFPKPNKKEIKIVNDLLDIGAKYGAINFIAVAANKMLKKEYEYPMKNLNSQTPADIARTNYPELAEILEKVPLRLPQKEEDYKKLRRGIIKKNAELIIQRIFDPSISEEKISDYLFSWRILREILDHQPDVLEGTYINFIREQPELYKEDIWKLLNKDIMILQKDDSRLKQINDLENLEIINRDPYLTSKCENLISKRQVKYQTNKDYQGLSEIELRNLILRTLLCHFMKRISLDEKKGGLQNYDEVELLIALGADPTVPDIKNRIALEFAKQGKFKILVIALKNPKYWPLFNKENLRQYIKTILLERGGIYIKGIPY